MSKKENKHEHEKSHVSEIKQENMSHKKRQNENMVHNEEHQHHKGGSKHGEGLEHTSQSEHANHSGHKENNGHENHHDHHKMMVEDFKKRFIISAILSIPVLFFSPTVQNFLGFEMTFKGVEYFSLLLSTIIYFYGGVPFFKGMKDEIQKGLPGMMTLVAIAISTAYLYSAAVVLFIEGVFFFWELVTLIDIMLLGHWLEMRSVMGASRALESLVKLMPSVAHKILEDGTVIDVATAELKPGDKVLIRPGENVPADGIIVNGTSYVNEAMLTGESKPVSKKPGDEVIGGSINGDGALTVEITRTGADTYLSKVIDLVKQAQATRSKTQDLANKAAFVLTIVAVVGGIATFVVWIALGKGITFALERMVTVMVIACPHALGLAVPLVVAVSTSISANNGLLIRNRTAFERGRNVDVIVFDKTGTLTEGKFGVTDVISLDGSEDKDIIQLAASLELNSEHPIAQGIVNFAEKEKIPLLKPENFKAIPGKGVVGIIDGQEVMVVSPGYLKEKGIEITNDKALKLQQQGKTTVFLLKNNKLVGAIALADIIREESREAVAKLHEMGIKCYMLTGDNKLVAQWVAEELKLDGFYAEVLPHEKSNAIKDLQSKGLIVAMVGDGVNDAPALVQADLGIAIGAGTDVAIESADIILVRSDPRDIVAIIKLARKTYGKMKQNLAWATGYNAFALPLAAGVLYNYGILVNPAIGAVLMSLSTVIVAINAKFLKM